MGGTLRLKQRPEVLVVHCVDTEGPIGGNVRRRPDGSKEFIDNWRDIRGSIQKLTNPQFRREAADSFGTPYMYNWFIMDFTGFKTNPKKRVARYHDTYDRFKSFHTKADGFYWHYHHPPADGRGDGWSEHWESSDEYLKILLHRLVEREDWPEAYRAGGSIEDNAQSQWLENTIMVDYSNRVSDRSYRTQDIFDFNWYGAPMEWGYYHPSRRNFLRRGAMRRFIVRSVDLWSRLHELSVEEVEQAFIQAQESSQPVILSFFSHDHRDMNDETHYAMALINLVSTRHGIPWRVCNAVEAVQVVANIRPVHVRVAVHRGSKTLRLTLNRDIYQPTPWVGARVRGGTLRWLPVKKVAARSFEVSGLQNATKIVIGGTSESGNKFIRVLS